MTRFDLRRLRCSLFSLHEVHKVAVQMSRNLEKLTEIPAVTLYDSIRCKIALDGQNLESNFLALVTKCIIVHNADNGVGLREACNGRTRTPRFFTNDLDADTTGKIFFNSELGRGLRRFLGTETIANFLENERVIVPSSILRLSHSTLYAHIRAIPEDDAAYKTLLRLAQSILKRKYKYRDGDNLRAFSQVFVQCSGRIIYNENIKKFDTNKLELKDKGNWSKMAINRKYIPYSGKIEGTWLFKTYVESVPPGDYKVWQLLSFVVFTDNYFDPDPRIRKEAVGSFYKALKEVSEGRIPKRKSLLRGLFVHFKQFVRNSERVDWKDRRFLKGESTPGMDFKTVSYANVFKYLRYIVAQTVPDELLCGRANYHKFLKACYLVMTMNKGETLSMAEVMKGIKIKECSWTTPGYHSRTQTRTILEYLCRVMFFILQYFILPVLGRHLRMSECFTTMYRTHYIRYCEWIKMIKEAKTEFMANGELCTKSADMGTLLKTRFVPKQSGMRPIINCNSTGGAEEFHEKIASKYRHKYKDSCVCYYCYVYHKFGLSRSDVNYCKNINSFLKLIHQALTHVSRSFPILGNGVLGYHSFYRHVKRWWVRFARAVRGAQSPKLHFFVADLSRCYERIPHDKLLGVIDELPAFESVFGVVYKRLFLRLASSVNSFARVEDFPTQSPPRRACLAARPYTNSLIASNNRREKTFRITKFDVVAAVSSMLSCQNLKLPNTPNNKYIKLTRGIPQGCTISPFLSSLYLASLDRKLFHHEGSARADKRAPPNLLVRWIDDILYVSTDPDDVRRKYEILCSENFGAMVNPKKVITNVKLEDDVAGGPDAPDGADPIEWINSTLNFDLERGFINIELAPWRSEHIKTRDSICLTRGKSKSFMFSTVEQRLVGYLTNKLGHKTYTCALINSPECIVSNAYIVMRNCALKLVCAMLELVERFGGFINTAYFYNLIQNLVTIATGLVSRGGLRVRRHNLSEMLMIAIINTFDGDRVGLLSAKFTAKCLPKIRKRIISRLYHHVKSLPNERTLFAVAAEIESSKGKTLSRIL